MSPIPPTPAVCPGVYSTDPCQVPAVTPGKRPKARRRRPVRRPLGRILPLIGLLEEKSKDLKRRISSDFPNEGFLSLYSTQKIEGLQRFVNFTTNRQQQCYAERSVTYWSLYEALQGYLTRLRDVEWQESNLDFHGPLHPRRKATTHQRQARRLQVTACNLLCVLAKAAPLALDDRTEDIPENLTRDRQWTPVDKGKMVAQIVAYVTLNNLETDFIDFMKKYFKSQSV